MTMDNIYTLIKLGQFPTEATNTSSAILTSDCCCSGDVADVVVVASAAVALLATEAEFAACLCII